MMIIIQSSPLPLSPSSSSITPPTYKSELTSSWHLTQVPTYKPEAALQLFKNFLNDDL
jgi:hypothetical protein